MLRLEQPQHTLAHTETQGGAQHEGWHGLQQLDHPALTEVFFFIESSINRGNC